MTHPPQGQNPFAPQQPQQPQGGNPFAQNQPQGGFPQQGAPYGQPQGGYPQGPGTMPMAPPPAPQNGNKAKVIKIVAVVAIIAIGGLLKFTNVFTSESDPKRAEVGDCANQGSDDDNNPDLAVVDCGDAKAEYKVLARIKGSFSTIGITEPSEAQLECEKHTKEADNFYTESGKGSNFLLCLEDLSK